MPDDARAPRRAPPAYLAYASDMLATESVREMSLEEIGLLVGMRWLCWANSAGDIPREPDRIARLLGKDQAEVQRAMTPAVMAFFEQAARTPSRLHCPELTAQRKRMYERSLKRTRIAKLGASARWKKGNGDASSNASSNASLKRTELTRRNGSSSPASFRVDDDDIPF